jgi:hypothetical protein
MGVGLISSFSFSSSLQYGHFGKYNHFFNIMLKINLKDSQPFYIKAIEIPLVNLAMVMIYFTNKKYEMIIY